MDQKHQNGAGREGQRGLALIKHRITENTKNLMNGDFINTFNVIFKSKLMRKDHSGQNIKR